MDDGFDHGAAAADPLSMLRSAATERLRQRLGPDGLAKASPLAIAELANEVLDGLVEASTVKPGLNEQRQLLRDTASQWSAIANAVDEAAPCIKDESALRARIRRLMD